MEQRSKFHDYKKAFEIFDKYSNRGFIRFEQGLLYVGLAPERVLHSDIQALQELNWYPSVRHPESFFHII